MTIDIVGRALPRDMLRDKHVALSAHVHAHAIKMCSGSTESNIGDSSKSSEPSNSTSRRLRSAVMLQYNHHKR